MLIALSVALAVAATDQPLDRCLASIRATRQARRITAATWDAHTRNLVVDQRVLESLTGQPEFKLPIWDYVAVMADQERVNDGQQRLTALRQTFEKIEARFGVDRHVVAAVWGIESNFGRGQGSFAIIPSLATLACHGRRQAYFRGEFLAALRILQAGDFPAARFLGSWAGAFGQTQFMPGTFEWIAVDFDGDGRRDLIDNTGDALASAANYLKKAGWQSGVPWGLEVRLPAGLALPARGRRTLASLGTWQTRGLTRVDGTPLVQRDTPNALMAGLHLPAGRSGPAFLVTRNYEAIFRYNAAESYALAIAHLSDRLRGSGSFATPWPTDDPGLSRAERRELQRILIARGHSIGQADAMLTPATRVAIRAEQERLGHEVTGRPGQRLLTALRAP